MEVEVGEYIRTDSGEIFKVIDIEKGSVQIKSDVRRWIGICCIKTHSKNIIDLIEVGDYVNGYRVEQVSIETNEVLLDHNGFGWITLKDGDKIGTHEQFSSIEYKVEESK